MQTAGLRRNALRPRFQVPNTRPTFGWLSRPIAGKRGSRANATSALFFNFNFSDECPEIRVNHSPLAGRGADTPTAIYRSDDKGRSMGTYWQRVLNDVGFYLGTTQRRSGRSWSINGRNRICGQRQTYLHVGGRAGTDPAETATAWSTWAGAERATDRDGG